MYLHKYKKLQRAKLLPGAISTIQPCYGKKSKSKMLADFKDFTTQRVFAEVISPYLLMYL
jgi:hypothetical protein